jgi:hypothetical protein
VSIGTSGTFFAVSEGLAVDPSGAVAGFADATGRFLPLACTANAGRVLVFDLNDFDETLPGPFDWDVKRLVASMAVAGRDNGFTAQKSRKVAVATAAAYRAAMQEFAAMSILNVWYARFDADDALAELKSEMPKKAVRQTKAQIARPVLGTACMRWQN